MTLTKLKELVDRWNAECPGNPDLYEVTIWADLGMVFSLKEDPVAFAGFSIAEEYYEAAEAGQGKLL
jgi:hypothetical protein